MLHNYFNIPPFVITHGICQPIVILMYVFGPVFPGQVLQLELYLPCSDGDATMHLKMHDIVLPSSAKCQTELVTFFTGNSRTVNSTIVSDANETCELFLTVTPYLYQVYEVFYVKLLPCPTGFVLKNRICDCDPVLLNSHIDSCDIDQSAIHHPANSWIAHAPSNNTKYLACSECPMNYCLRDSSYLDFLQPDTQCQFNRTGILCSQCPHSLSMVFGSSRCVQCSNVHILIGTVLLFAGVLLIASLYVLNLTVTNGTINRIIFYANIISINDSVFLTNNLFKPLHIFICDRISHNKASTHTKSNLRFYQKWIAGLINYHISHCTSFSTDKSGFCSSFLPTLSKPRA